jgi:hypothetical protein
MSDILMGNAYTPAEAERGKFAVIDPTTLSALGLTGSYGRYAVLTYSIGGDTSSTILSGGLPNTTKEIVSTFSANGSGTISFNPAITLMEISNRSGNSIYLTYSPTTFATLTANGLEISNGAFYSIERTVTAVTIGSVAGGDVVVFGHYKA